MSRLARMVVPGAPHHVTQRGNRRQPVFFEDGDYRYYSALRGAAAEKAGTQIWAYCLMPNHVHLILRPAHADGLRATLGDTHRRYTRFINARNKWTGHLWQGRFGSVALDEAHLANALRYVSLNPVRARLVKKASAWPWSSVKAHLSGKGDGLVTVKPVLDRFPDFAGLLEAGEDEEQSKALRAAETTGRPLGDPHWLDQIEAALGRSVRAGKRGPKARGNK